MLSRRVAPNAGDGPPPVSSGGRGIRSEVGTGLSGTVSKGLGHWPGPRDESAVRAVLARVPGLEEGREWRCHGDESTDHVIHSTRRPPGRQAPPDPPNPQGPPVNRGGIG